MLRKYRVNRELVLMDLYGPKTLTALNNLKLVEPPPIEEEELPPIAPTETASQWKINAGQATVLKHFQRIFPVPIADLELSKHFCDMGSTSRSRRKELTDAGLIAFADGKRKIGRTNHKLWILTDKGRAVDLS